MKKIIITISAIALIILGKFVFDEIDIYLQVKNNVLILSGEIQELNIGKKYEEALKLSNKTLKKYPDSVDILYARAEAYKGLKNYKSALDDYNLIINMKDDRNVDLSEVYSKISDIYSDNKEYQKALDILDKAIEINPKECGLYFDISEIKNKISDYENALKYSTKSIECNPYKSVYYYQRMNLYSKLKEDENSKNDRAKADEMSKFSKDLHEIRMLSLEDKNKEALAKCDELIKKYPTSTELIEIKADIFVKQEEYDVALKYYEGLEKTHNIDNTHIYKEKAFLYHMKKENQKALDMANKAIESDKTNNDYLYSLRGAIKRDLKDYDGAINDYTSAIKYNPYDAHHYFDRAMIYEKIGNQKEYNADMKKYDSFKF